LGNEMKRVIFLFLLLAASPSYSLAQQNAFKALRKGMELHSDSLMRTFFEAWYKSSKPLRKKPHTLLQRESEAIVEILWNPNYQSDLQPPYIAPQSIVPIYIDSESSPSDSLYNMFPETFYKSKDLVPIEKFEDSLGKYLSTDFKNRKDQDYISWFITLSCHMTGCGIGGEPFIEEVKFDRTIQKADVSYWQDMEGREATFSKVNGKWQLIKEWTKGVE
jgi:hypothetical protein